MGFNLHSVVAPLVGAVNGNQPVTLRLSAGYTTLPDFSRVPQYTTLRMNAQIQGLGFQDLITLNGLGIQGVRRKVYLWGAVHGLLRGPQLGNDVIIFPDGSVWKVVYVFEDYGHGVTGATGWVSVACTLQNPASEGGAAISMPAGAPFNAAGRLNG